MEIYEEEIVRRKEIMSRAYAGQRLSTEERQWLMTHSVYNETKGYPYLRRSIEAVEARKWYTLSVCIESVTEKKRFAPCLSIPFGKGQMLANFELEDFYGNRSIGKPVKMISLDWDKENLGPRKVEIDYRSELGYLAVDYDGMDYNPTLKKDILVSSFDEGNGFSMIREQIAENKVRFRCKSSEGDSFDALIFTLEWIEQEKK